MAKGLTSFVVSTASWSDDLIESEISSNIYNDAKKKRKKKEEGHDDTLTEINVWFMYRLGLITTVAFFPFTRLSLSM
jgi:hypothetical protein